MRLRLWLTTSSAVLLLLTTAAAAHGALPRTYQVQAVASPNPTAVARFGIAFVNAGDENGDGKDDIVVGTDEHGGAFAGIVYVISGADGSAIRTLTPPDANVSGNGVAWGGYVGKIGMNASQVPLSDIGSCPGGTPSTTCPGATMGAPDGIPDLLITALGVDVPTVGCPETKDAQNNIVQPADVALDIGRAYVVDGATGAVLKRLDMPAADRLAMCTVVAGPVKAAFGRTILAPAGQAPCAGNMGVGTCPATPFAVKVGDMQGGDGSTSCSAAKDCPDIIVSASDYFETDSTAHPDSDCATANGGGPNTCIQAGRSYIFRGEDIVGTDSSAVDSTPSMVIKNPAAQADELAATVNHNRENLGYSIAPIGDVGKCKSTLVPGAYCLNSGKPDSTTTPDGAPDVVISSHRTDDFGMWDVGVALLVDGATGTVLATYRHPEPQPASLFAFSNYNQPAIGDAGSGTNPDSYQAAMRQNNPFTGGGRGYVMNGNFLQTGSPNGISFSTLSDPTPNPSEDFGTSSAGVGDIAGAETSPELDTHTEIMIGAYGPHNPGTDPATINDVHIFSPINERELQRFDSPEQQPGSAFGNALAPLGDVNGDGFLDFAIGAGFYDETPSGAPPLVDAGRIYLFKSDNSPAPPSQPPPSNQGPAGPQGATGPAGPTGQAVVQNGRAVELDANPGRVRRGKSTKLSGVIDAFAGGSTCSAGQDVLVQRRFRGNPHYRRLRTVKTNRSGDFSLTTKPSKTTFYRALVAQTGACLGDTSPRETVVVTAPPKRRR